MTDESTTAILAGFVNPTGQQAGFVIPVFADQHGGNAMLAQTLRANDRIKTFKAVELPTVATTPIKDTRTKRAGQTGLWGFQFRDGSYAIETRAALQKVLLAARGAYRNQPFLFLQIVQFCNLANETESAIQSAYAYLRSHSSESADAWRDVVFIPTLLRNAIASMFPKAIDDDLLTDVRVNVRGKHVEAVLPPTIFKLLHESKSGAFNLRRALAEAGRPLGLTEFDIESDQPSRNFVQARSAATSLLDDFPLDKWAENLNEIVAFIRGRPCQEERLATIFELILERPDSAVDLLERYERDSAAFASRILFSFRRYLKGPARRLAYKTGLLPGMVRDKRQIEITHAEITTEVIKHVGQSLSQIYGMRKGILFLEFAKHLGWNAQVRNLLETRLRRSKSTYLEPYRMEIQKVLGDHSQNGMQKHPGGARVVSDKKPPVEAEIAAIAEVSASPSVVVTRQRPRDLDSKWFQVQERAAESGIAQLESLRGWMEVRFVPETHTSKSAKELLEAVQASEIKTFGWPIGVTLQSRPEYRPKPTEIGIKAEVSIKESQVSGRPSYDYWALTQNADFFLLQSLFEDMRSAQKLFFNTRIVRVTESFLFAATLYDRLGLPPETKLQARFKHMGLKGRELSSSSPNRPIYEKKISDANESETTLAVTVKDIRTSVVELVRSVCAPMFEKFDFMHFGDAIYDDIVRRFEEGVVT